MFKKGPVPSVKGPTPANRIPFEKIVDRIIEEYTFRGDEVKVIEKPLWQMDPKDVYEEDADMTFVPHKEDHNFPVPGKRVMYYQQMVLPQFFSINKKGWLAGATYYPIKPDGDPYAETFDIWSQRSKNNQSKFDQPPRLFGDFPHRDYILFPCQLPHDETIKYHSDISVEQALDCVANYCEKENETLVVKGHPINPGSMQSLKNVVKGRKNVIWEDHGSIFDYIEYAKKVCVVNSGTGFESILMKKPVIAFGRAEYDKVVNKANLKNYMEVIKNASFDFIQYKCFIDMWVRTIMYNSDDSYSFRKLPSINSF